ncbi:MAG: hypothetical protein IRZ00_18365 [Gemmatimonadetes bacterium]|nr:hypothetical protein [Gemmatimonadota bacterium]
MDFAVEGAGVVEYAAVPTLRFALRIGAPAGQSVRALSLAVQVRIAAERRTYDAQEKIRLHDLFGAPERWGTTLRSLLWTHAAAQVPGFTGTARIDLPVPCTYDFEVTAAKYLHALGDDGVVPLEFLFSGSVFYAGAGGLLQVGRLGWDREARFAMPVAVWRRAMDHYFPSAAWLRLHRDTFDRLAAFRARRALPTWEAALDALLDAAGGGER